MQREQAKDEMLKYVEQMWQAYSYESDSVNKELLRQRALGIELAAEIIGCTKEEIEAARHRQRKTLQQKSLTNFIK